MPLLPLQKGLSIGPMGRYSVIEEIGAGGFGITYLVKDTSLDVECVVKEFAFDPICARNIIDGMVIVREGKGEAMARWIEKFIDEARNLAKISHPAVVRVRDVWLERGTAYYAMDKIMGGELTSPLLPDWKGRNWLEVEMIAIELLHALIEVHAAHLVHGDIKPANVLIRTNTQKPVLIDFGTARSLTQVKRTVTTLAFTPGYAPPEIQDFTRSKERGPWSDLYSWAMIIIGLMVRHPSMDGEPSDAKIRLFLSKRGQDDYDNLSKILENVEIPNHVVSILQQCVLLDPKKRFQSSKETLLALKTPVLKVKSVSFPNYKPVSISISESLSAPSIDESLSLSMQRSKSVSDPVPTFEEVSKPFEGFSSGEIKSKKSTILTVFELDPLELKKSLLNKSKKANKPKKNSSEFDDAEISKPFSPLVEPVTSKKVKKASKTLENPSDELISKEQSEKQKEIPAFIQLSAGSFKMGSPLSESGRFPDESLHEVILTHDFYMQSTPVTQKQWQDLMGNNPSYFSGENCPVEQVNWYEACAYANALSRKEGLKEAYLISDCNKKTGEGITCRVEITADTIYACEGYRLPTEAEWEYAARAGTSSTFADTTLKSLHKTAWFLENAEKSTHLVAQKSPNSLGLYDMSGNVWEWCWDIPKWKFRSNSTTDPAFSAPGFPRILRGGCWSSQTRFLRAATRYSNGAGRRDYRNGFRLCRSILTNSIL